MARRLRLQFPGALYHVINRGNYRAAVFGSSGASRAFLLALAEACTRHGWRVHAYAVMRNHFHLALETPEPNLIEGMHWLQGTYAARFNRFRDERGHLFQGRYQAILVENAAALLRVVDYIHLNPVRAHLVPASRMAAYPGGSLAQFIKRSRPAWLVAETILSQLGLNDSRTGWSRYLGYLADLSGDKAAQQQLGFSKLTRGWAIGTPAWKRALAEEHARRALEPGFSAAEIKDLKEARWRALLEAELRFHGKAAADLPKERKNIPWKLAVAARLRREASAPHRWITETLKMGTVGSLRVALARA